MTQTFAFAGTSFEGLTNLSLATSGQSGLPAGLGGLFSSLVGVSAANVPASPQVAAQVTLPILPDMAALMNPLPQTGEGGEAEAMASADSLAALRAILEQVGLGVETQATASDAIIAQSAQSPDPLEVLAAIVQQIQQKGIETTPEQVATPEGLAKLLEAAGIEPAEVQTLAQQLASALDDLKKKLDLSSEQAGVLAHVLAAAQAVVTQASLNQAQPMALMVEKTAAQGQPLLSHEVDAALKTAAALPGNQNLAREMAGLENEPSQTTPVTDDAVPAAETLPMVAVVVEPTHVTVKSVTKTTASMTSGPAAAENNIALATNIVAAVDVTAPIQGDVKFVWKGEDSAKSVEPKASKDVVTELSTEARHAMHAVTAETSLRSGANAADATGHSDFARHVENYQRSMELAKRFDVAGQAVVQMKNLIDQGGGQVRVRLNPPELGQIYVDLVVKDGAVSGRISATDPAVVNALAGDVKQFGDGLKQAGLKLGNEGLSFMLNQQNNQQQQNQQQFGQALDNPGWAGENMLVDEEEPLVASTPVWVAPDRLLDMNI